MKINIPKKNQYVWEGMDGRDSSYNHLDSVLMKCSQLKISEVTLQEDIGLEIYLLYQGGQQKSDKINVDHIFVIIGFT